MGYLQRLGAGSRLPTRELIHHAGNAARESPYVSAFFPTGRILRPVLRNLPRPSETLHWSRATYQRVLVPTVEQDATRSSAALSSGGYGAAPMGSETRRLARWAAAVLGGQKAPAVRMHGGRPPTMRWKNPFIRPRHRRHPAVRRQVFMVPRTATAPTQRLGPCQEALVISVLDHVVAGSRLVEKYAGTIQVYSCLVRGLKIKTRFSTEGNAQRSPPTGRAAVFQI